MATRVSKGGWTLEEIDRAIFAWPSDVPMGEPIGDKVSAALVGTLPIDLYGYTIAKISTGNFISKRLALALLDWLIIDRNSWKVDPDKILSLRRIRVTDFLKEIKESPEIGEELDSAAAIMQTIGDRKFWNVSKQDFSKATSYVSGEIKMPIFQVLNGLIALDDTGYDVASALLSCAYWCEHVKSELKFQQLELL